MIDLFAITDHPAPPLPAVGELQLGTAGAGALAVVWAPADDGPAEVTIDALRRHEAIVEALLADRDVLPMRFGTRVADVGAAARVLIENRAELTAALARIRGTVEVAVRVAAAPGTSGTKDRALAAVHRPLAARAHAATSRRAAGGDLLRSAYLVQRDGVAEFTAAVSDLQGACPDLRLLCTGPWPPYSFTG